MRSVEFVLLVLVCFCQHSQQKFSIPDVYIQAIKPKGIVVSLPDSDGIQFFGFHGNVNQPIKGKEDGSISKQVARANNGLWQIKDENVELKPGDIIHYWVFVQHNRLGFDKQDQRFTVSALVDAGTPPEITTVPSVTTCIKQSVTTINGGKNTCEARIIFEDNFQTFDDTKWEKQYYIADKPDMEFVTYERSNAIVENGMLNLRANLREDVENTVSLDFTDGCTGRVCSKRIAGKLMLPVIAGQVKSRFSFRYGKVEIKAQLPTGDWVYPQLNLETKDPLDVYNNGRIWVAYSRGNANLKSKSNEELGNTVLYAGPVAQQAEPQRSSAAKMFHLQGGGVWSNDVHTFTLTWKPDSMTVAVDGDQMSIFNPAVPFNKEMLLTLGIAVGGHSDFPDDSNSGGHIKPYKRTTFRDTTAFYEKRNNWLPTWQNGVSNVKVHSVKVWAL